MGRPRKNPPTVINVCEHCNKEYEVKYQKRTQRFCGKVCANASPQTKKKITESQKKTFIKNYGVDHPMKTSKVVENLKTSMKKIYGVEHALQQGEFLQKCKDTKKNRYGDENYNNKEQIKKTCIKRYGCENIRQSSHYVERYYTTCMEKYKVSHASKSEQFRDSHKFSFLTKVENEDRFLNFERLFSDEEYEKFNTGKYYEKKYLFRCRRCNNESHYNISGGRKLYCPVCDKKYSRVHHEVLEFLHQHDDSWECNTRSVIKPLEIDIFSEKFKMGIECDSLYWHSEVHGKKNKVYHLNKNKLALTKGIQLIHVWDIEWISKQDIVKSILLNNLNLTQNKIYGRECVIKEITPKIANNFLSENHIQGSDRASIRLGLFHNDELVAVMTFCKSRFDKKIQYEMSRFCNKTYTSIMGGASKLFQHFIKTYNPTSVVSYSDRRYFSGEIYNKLGFKFVDNSPPNYYYIIGNYLTTENRIQFQKHKLKKKLPSFDESLSEWKNMKANGFDRIWDCGNSKWIYFKN